MPNFFQASIVVILNTPGQSLKNQAHINGNWKNNSWKWWSIKFLSRGLEWEELDEPKLQFNQAKKNMELESL